MKKIITLTLLGSFLLTGCMSAKSPQVVATGENPVVSATVTEINASDIMSRQFTLNKADLVPVNSKRPSAVIFFRNGVNVAKMNKALCEGFVTLPTIENVVVTQDVAEEDQVVTKVPVKLSLTQDFSDCDEILKVYDYDVAREELSKLNNKALEYSNGPFVAVYYPNSTTINQLIDLRGTSEKDLKKFGENWSSIFTKAANNHKTLPPVVGEQKFNIWSFLKDVIQVTVCATDPNLIYIFNEPAGKIADIVCKGTAENTAA